MKKLTKIFTTCSGLLGIMFSALFVCSVISVAKGAWWHTFTAIVSFIMAYMMWLDIKSMKDDE